MITPYSLDEALSKSEKIVSDEVKAYLKHPDEDNVHDLRTSIRRFLATANILPKPIREQKKSRKLLNGYERLLKLNTNVRDIDIVLSKLPNHGDDPAYTILVKKLQKSRESELKQAQRFVASINDKSPLKLGADEISSSTLQKRFRKTVNSLTKKLSQGFRAVTSDPKNLKGLHRLREDSRRLHFILEVDDNPQASRLLPMVKAWQEVLGKIRDSDIFISRLNDEENTTEISQVLRNEMSNRDGNFEKFLEIAKESPGVTSSD